MNFRNPCLKCLVRPCCDRSCEEYRKFDDATFEPTMKISLCLSIVLCIATIVLILYLASSGLIGFGFIILLWIYTYFISLHILTKYELIKPEELEPFDEENLVLMCLAPFMFWMTIILLLITLYSKPAWERNGNN